MAKRREKDRSSMLYTTGDVARILDIPISTQKYWERKGYLLPVRFAGRHRRYGEEELRRLLQVKVLTEKYHLAQEVLEAIGRGEAVAMLLPWETRGEAADQLEAGTTHDELVGQAARSAQSFAQHYELARGLSMAREHYRLLVEGLPDIVATADANGIISYVSQSTGLYGFNTQDFVGKPLTDFLPLDGSLTSREVVEDILRGNSEQFCGEFEMPSSDGRMHVFNVRAVAVKDGDKPAGVLAVAREITEKKKAEEELKASNKLLENLFSSLNEAVFLVSPSSRIIQKCNRTAEEMFGYSRNELMGRDTRMLHVNDDAFLSFPCIDAPAPGAQRSLAFEFQMRRKNGEVFPTEHFVTRVYDEGDQYLRVVSVVRDITSRKQAEERLRESEERFRLTFDQLPIGAAIVSLGYRFQRVNEAMCRFTGYSAEELTTLSFGDITHPDDLIPNLDSVKRLFAGEIDHFQTDKRYVRKDGQVVWGHLSVRMMRGDNGEPLYFLPLVEDITERKRAEEEVAYLTFRDRLTGLYNRAYLEEQLERFDAASQLPLSVITVDVNGLKLVNDAFGRQAGDKVLAGIAHVLANCAGRDDMVCRWGGDAFVMVLPHTPESVALEVCDWIKESFESIAGGPIPLSLASGTATKTDAGQSIEDLLRESEDRMYRQKLLDSSSARSSIISSLARTLSERSYETEEHAERLKDLALKLGASARLSTTELDKLALLAALHDIGKIAIPDSIVMKAGPLTDDEWEIMRRHTEIGYRIAQSSPELSAVALAILSHHERWDGAGYPQGLKGEQIEIISRITAVVDAYDAMTHDRPYQPAISHEQALAEIRRRSGSQFDPDLVQKFMITMATASTG